jgi:hypothetical protein
VESLEETGGETMYRRVLALALSLTLILTFVAVPAFAQKGPPPPKKEVSCSPGFWKAEVHLDLWDSGVCCDGDARTAGTECNGILVTLSTGGGGITAVLRQQAAAFLNACFEELGQDPCPNE